MIRCSPRCHHTRCGIWCTSGYAPVEIEARQTGVSEGKTEAARRYSPCSARKRIAGVSAASNIDGVRPSITITTTGFGTRPLVLCERAQAGVPVRRAAAQAQAEHGHRDRLEVADDGHERERGDDERRRARAAPRSRRACRRGGACRRRAAPSRASRRSRRRSRRRPRPTARTRGRSRAATTAATSERDRRRRREHERWRRSRAPCPGRRGCRSCTSRPSGGRV